MAEVKWRDVMCTEQWFCVCLLTTVNMTVLLEVSGDFLQEAGPLWLCRINCYRKRGAGRADDGSAIRSPLLQCSPVVCIPQGPALPPNTEDLGPAGLAYGQGAGPGRACGGRHARHSSMTQQYLESQNSSPGQLGGVCWLLNHVPVGRLQQPLLASGTGPPSLTSWSSTAQRQEMARGGEFPPQHRPGTRHYTACLTQLRRQGEACSISPQCREEKACVHAQLHRGSGTAPNPRPSPHNPHPPDLTPAQPCCHCFPSVAPLWVGQTRPAEACFTFIYFCLQFVHFFQPHHISTASLHYLPPQRFSSSKLLQLAAGVAVWASHSLPQQNQPVSQLSQLCTTGPMEGKVSSRLRTCNQSPRSPWKSNPLWKTLLFGFKS